MKKLMIAAAIVCAAVVSQAADANWKFSTKDVFDGTGSEEDSALFTGAGYIFDASGTAQAALYSIIAASGDITAASGYVGTFAIDEGSAPLTQHVYGETGSYSKDFYFVIVDDDKAYFSTIKNTAAPTTSTAKNVLFGSQFDGSVPMPTGTGFAGEGKWSAVPEPTSGLLLLLGVAGLALRRRRA